MIESEETIIPDTKIHQLFTPKIIFEDTEHFYRCLAEQQNGSQEEGALHDQYALVIELGVARETQISIKHPKWN